MQCQPSKGLSHGAEKDLLNNYQCSDYFGHVLKDGMMKVRFHLVAVTLIGGL